MYIFVLVGVPAAKFFLLAKGVVLEHEGREPAASHNASFLGCMYMNCLAASWSCIHELLSLRAKSGFCLN